ncbi:MAG: FAD-binding protein [Desulfitobacteriaceae bacterium]|nr:FAD-binding protein [Desulfitobacteriaceae bacterium]
MVDSAPENLHKIEEVVLETDILIIGGGNAGCFTAIEAKKINSDLKVTIMEKAHIDRSGCLAGGMDAINTYIPEGKTPEDLVRWSRAQAGGILREDRKRKIIPTL